MIRNFDDLIESEQFRRWFLPAAALIFFALFVSLGLWQLDRAAEKNAVSALFEDAAPYARVNGDMPVTEFQLIEARGRYLGERQVLIDNMIVDGRIGYYAITAFRYAPGEPLLLVNRGWIPRTAGDSSKPVLGVAGDARTIRGRAGYLPKVGIRSPEAFRVDDAWPKTASYPTLPELSAELGEELLPFILLLGPEADDGFLRRWRPTESGPMMHYGYALQWFAMAVAVAGIFAWRLRKKSA